VPNVKKMIVSSMLITNALTIFILETQLPPIVPIPGIKLGLANVITLFAIYLIGCKEAAKIHTLRIILGSIFAGQKISFLYSISGGILSLLIMIVGKHIISKDFIWLVGILSAVLHAAGQLGIAILVLGTMSILYYAPIILISSIITGLFTGLCVQLLLKKHEKAFYRIINQ